MYNVGKNQKNTSRNLGDTHQWYDDSCPDQLCNAKFVYKLLANNYTVETDRNLHSNLDVYGLY
ncbi:uncharacterized protein METZ01_LOCUS192739 [marine metagenome]|uniref:Uncharacterized protein n=1 Tax=marine metagenome TaxID=408172 RepID=A0A382DNT1_9ZZZZ